MYMQSISKQIVNDSPPLLRNLHCEPSVLCFPCSNLRWPYTLYLHIFVPTILARKFFHIRQGNVAFYRSESACQMAYRAWGRAYGVNVRRVLFILVFSATKYTPKTTHIYTSTCLFYNVCIRFALSPATTERKTVGRKCSAISQAELWGQCHPDHLIFATFIVLSAHRKQLGVL